MDHVSQVGLCYRADPPNRPGGTDQSILRALSDLMPVIADQSRWDDLTQVCDQSPGLRSAGHARGTRLVSEAQPGSPRVVDLVPAAWPCIFYVLRLAMYTSYGRLGCVYLEWYVVYHTHCHIHHMWYTPVPVLKCGSVMLVATAGKVTTSRLLSPVPPTSSNVICHKHRSYDLTQVYCTSNIC